MARSQSRVNRQLNEEKVLDDIKKALRSHEMQQDSALEATAYCYAAWTDTQSQYASKEAKAWIQEQFDRVNETIDAHNAGIELNKTQATEYAEGKLDKSDLIFSEPKDDIEKKAIEERIAQLALWNTWDRKDWAAAKLVRVEVPIPRSSNLYLVSTSPINPHQLIATRSPWNGFTPALRIAVLMTSARSQML